MQSTFLTGHRRFAVMAALAVGAALLGQTSVASADPPATKAEAKETPRAEVMIVHATKCERKSVDPAIGDTPPALGYDCLKLIEKKTMVLPLNQGATTLLPNGRTFQLLHSARVGARYKITASISPADGSAGFTKLADITADANKPFNVGGFTYKGGVLVVTVRILPPER
jgi:hypothetical protein